VLGGYLIFLITVGSRFSKIKISKNHEQMGILKMDKQTDHPFWVFGN
jgi:hypothetical protein